MFRRIIILAILLVTFCFSASAQNFPTDRIQRSCTGGGRASVQVLSTGAIVLTACTGQEIRLYGDVITSIFKMNGIAAPSVSSAGTSKCYFDSTSNTIKCSYNTGAYFNLARENRQILAGTGLSGGGDLTADRTISLANTAVTPGAYTNTSLTVDAQGRITAAANGTAVAPGGSDTQLQYNNAGAFGGVSGATSNGTNVTLGSGNLTATRPKFITSIDDTNGNEVIKIVPTASAVNEITITNAATAGDVYIDGSGSDTNVGVALRAKGTGGVGLSGAGGVSLVGGTSNLGINNSGINAAVGSGTVVVDGTADMTFGDTAGVSNLTTLNVDDVNFQIKLENSDGITSVGDTNNHDTEIVVNDSAGTIAMAATNGVTAPTVAVNNISTQVANTAYVGILRSYLASTITYNNIDTLANTALSVTVEAGKAYNIELVVHSTNANTSLNMDFAGTATIINFIGVWVVWQVIIDESGPSRIRGARVTSAGTDFTSNGVDAMDSFYTFKGSVLIDAAGTFLLRGAQNAAFASDTTILLGSTLVLTKLN